MSERGCWLNLDTVQFKRRETTEVKWGNLVYHLKGFSKKDAHKYEVICNDNKKYNFNNLESWINLADLEVEKDKNDIYVAKLIAGKTLYNFGAIVSNLSRISLLDFEGTEVKDVDCGKLFNFASFKFDKNYKGYYMENGKKLAFQGLDATKEGLITMVDEHATLRFCDFINPFFRISA